VGRKSQSALPWVPNTVMPYLKRVKTSKSGKKMSQSEGIQCLNKKSAETREKNGASIRSEKHDTDKKLHREKECTKTEQNPKQRGNAREERWKTEKKKYVGERNRLRLKRAEKCSQSLFRKAKNPWQDFRRRRLKGSHSECGKSKIVSPGVKRKN